MPQVMSHLIYCMDMLQKRWTLLYGIGLWLASAAALSGDRSEVQSTRQSSTFHVRRGMQARKYMVYSGMDCEDVTDSGAS
jgi:hypothetical protein